MQASQSLADGLEKFLPDRPRGLNRSGEFKAVYDGHADVRE